MSGTTWTPRADLPYYCGACGANVRLHAQDGRCPEGWRPETLAAAMRELAAARASGNPDRVFVARGEVQRLGGDPDTMEVSK